MAAVTRRFIRVNSGLRFQLVRRISGQLPRLVRLPIIHPRNRLRERDKVDVGAGSDEPQRPQQSEGVSKPSSTAAASLGESLSDTERAPLKTAQDSASSLHRSREGSTRQQDRHSCGLEAPDDEWSSVSSLQLATRTTSKPLDPSGKRRSLKGRPVQVYCRLRKKRKRLEPQARDLKDTELDARSPAVVHTDDNLGIFSPTTQAKGTETVQGYSKNIESGSAGGVTDGSSGFPLDDSATIARPAQENGLGYLRDGTIDGVPRNLPNGNVSALSPGGSSNSSEDSAPEEGILHISALTHGVPLYGSIVEAKNELDDVEPGQGSLDVAREISATQVLFNAVPASLETQQLQLISNLTSLTSVLSKVADRISRKSKSSRKSSRTVGSHDTPASETSGSNTDTSTPSTKGSTHVLSPKNVAPLSATAEVGLQTHFSSASSSTGNISTTPTSCGGGDSINKARKTSSSTRKPHVCASRSFCCSIVRSQKQEKPGSELHIRVCPSVSQEQVHNCARCQRRQERLGKVVHVCRHLSHEKGYRKDQPQSREKRSTTTLSQSTVSCSDSMSSSTVSSVKKQNPSTTTIRSVRPFDEQKQLLKQARSSETAPTQPELEKVQQPRTPSPVKQSRSVSFEIRHAESTFTTDEKSYGESPTRRLSREELQEKLGNLQVERGFVTPVIEMMYHLFALIGLSNVSDHETVPCHPDDAKAIWNAWKDKLSRLSGCLRRFRTGSCLSGYAQFSFDRLLHFVKMYCTPSDSESSMLPIPDDDKSAVLELFQAGVIEIPINRPKIFVQDAAANQQILQAFVLKNFCTDAEGQARSILRQKFPFYIHLYKTGSAGTLNAEEAKEIGSMLVVFREDHNQLLSKKCEVLVAVAVNVWTSQQADPKLPQYLLELHEETLRWLVSTAVLNYGQSLGPEQAVQMVMSKYLKNWDVIGKDIDSQTAVAVDSKEGLVAQPENARASEDPNKVPKNAKGSKAALISTGLQESLQRFRLSNSAVWPPLCSHSSEKTDSGSQPASPARPTHAIAVATPGQAWPNHTVPSSLKVAVDHERNPLDSARTFPETRATVPIPSAAPKQFQNLKTKHHLILNQRIRRSETTMRGKGNESVGSSVLETDSSISFELSRGREHR